MSDLKAQIVAEARLDTLTIHGFLPMAYDSLREALEAFCVLHGYKVTSHECLGKLVKQLFAVFDYFSFERFRYVRNGINYYGTKLALEEGKELIAKILRMKREIAAEVNRRLL
jgi:hypothetical protein